MIGLKIATQGFGGPIFGAGIAAQGYVSVYDFQRNKVSVLNRHKVPHRLTVFDISQRVTIHPVPTRKTFFEV